MALRFQFVLKTLDFTCLSGRVLIFKLSHKELISINWNKKVRHWYFYSQEGEVYLHFALHCHLIPIHKSHFFIFLWVASSLMLPLPPAESLLFYMCLPFFTMKWRSLSTFLEIAQAINFLFNYELRYLLKLEASEIILFLWQ